MESENTGYRQALELAQSALAAADPLAVAANTGVHYHDGAYAIPWCGGVVPFSHGSLPERIVWLHYMLARGPKMPSGRCVSYREIPGAAIYHDAFIRRNIRPMVNAYHTDPNAFLLAGRRIGAMPLDLGHAAFTVQALPYIPLTYILWQGDDEVPPGGNILFDASAADWLCAEDLAVLAGLPLRRMTGARRRKTAHI